MALRRQMIEEFVSEIVVSASTRDFWQTRIHYISYTITTLSIIHSPLHINNNLRPSLRIP